MFQGQPLPKKLMNTGIQKPINTSNSPQIPFKPFHVKGQILTEAKSQFENLKVVHVHVVTRHSSPDLLSTVS